MHVLQTLPEEVDGLSIDVILIENEKTSRVCPGALTPPGSLIPQSLRPRRLPPAPEAAQPRTPDHRGAASHQTW